MFGGDVLGVKTWERGAYGGAKHREAPRRTAYFATDVSRRKKPSRHGVSAEPIAVHIKKSSPLR